MTVETFLIWTFWGSFAFVVGGLYVHAGLQIVEWLNG
jgi:hypothetical protein